MFVGAAEQKEAQEAEALALLGCSTAMNSQTCSSLLCKVWAKNPLLKDFIWLRTFSSSHETVLHCWCQIFPLDVALHCPRWGIVDAPDTISSPSACSWHEFTPWLWLQYFFLESSSPRSFWDLSACLCSTFLFLPDNFIPFWAEC